jgi:hypothetical protein
MRILTGLLLVLAIGGGESTLQFQVRVLTPKNYVPDALIVGRTGCGSSVWLLTDAPQLVEIAPDRRVTVQPLRKALQNDRPWGLACVADALWTLANPRTLARVTRDGDIAERLDLRLPRIAVFAAGQKLVYQQLPTVIAESVLAAGPPRDLLDIRPWPGLLGRAGESRDDQLTRNLVNCGLSHKGWLPCWFADRAEITISDGVSSVTTSSQPLLGKDGDPSLPLWDVALAEGSRLWMLATTTASAGDRRIGGQLIAATQTGGKLGQVLLRPAARLILSATATRCLLLTAQGELMEVVAQ